jgi:hypothetical protein
LFRLLASATAALILVNNTVSASRVDLFMVAPSSRLASETLGPFLMIDETDAEAPV